MRLVGQLAWFLLWVGVTGIALLLTPSPHGSGTHQQLGFPPCTSALFFQRPCPACGLTTSFSATVHLDFASAWRAHPFGLVFYALFTASAWACLYGFVKRRRFVTSGRAFSTFLTVLLAAYVVYGLVRMALVEKLPHSEASRAIVPFDWTSLWPFAPSSRGPK